MNVEAADDKADGADAGSVISLSKEAGLGKTGRFEPKQMRFGPNGVDIVIKTVYVTPLQQ